MPEVAITVVRNQWVAQNCRACGTHIPKAVEWHEALRATDLSFNVVRGAGVLTSRLSNFLQRGDRGVAVPEVCVVVTAMLKKTFWTELARKAVWKVSLLALLLIGYVDDCLAIVSSVKHGDFTPQCHVDHRLGTSARTPAEPDHGATDVADRTSAAEQRRSGIERPLVDGHRARTFAESLICQSLWGRQLFVFLSLRDFRLRCTLWQRWD